MSFPSPPWFPPNETIRAPVKKEASIGELIARVIIFCLITFVLFLLIASLWAEPW